MAGQLKPRRHKDHQGAGSSGAKVSAFESFVPSWLTLSAHKPGDRFRKPPRRGIVLLIVISLLALFVLIGVTFVLVSSHYVTSARVTERIDQVGDYPDREFDILIGQLLSDTAARSALRSHSLLGDLYGLDGLQGTVSGAPASQWGGQAYSFTYTVTSGTASDVVDYYTGRVITFFTGGRYYSTRVLQFDPTTTTLHVETIRSQNATVVVPNSGDSFLINGAPFNGAGAGYDDQTFNLDLVYGDSRTFAPPNVDYVALLPHLNGYDPAFGSTYRSTGTAPDSYNAIGKGGLDESYDAVDFQNMFLAMVPPDIAEKIANGTAGTNDRIIPSFHRPELVNFWIAYIRNTLLSSLAGNPTRQYEIIALPYGNNRRRENGGGDDPTEVTPDVLDRIYNLTRCSIFRPMPWDHENFTGGNPLLAGSNWQAICNNLISGNFWDIDNDNDGVPDSIWVDPGLPIVTSKDGKRYKRLVAILVKDLDGKIQLNAHGNSSTASDPNQRAETVTPGALGLAAAGSYLPRGIGFGPADVSFLNLLSGDTAAYQSVLQGRYASNFANDSGGTAVPGQPNVRDSFSIVKHHGVPNNYTALGGWYASHPDVWGRGAIVLDHGGHPTTAFMGQNNEMLDNPYEMTLSGGYDNADSPYSIVELEKLLRYHDIDAQLLPCRLCNGAAGTYFAGQQGVITGIHTNRERMSGMGSHLPVAGAPTPTIARASVGIQKTIIDLYRQRLLAGGVTNANLNSEIYKIVPWEFRKGQLLDINRWVGDGFDSNGDNVPDDPAEAFVGENAWVVGSPAGFAGAAAQHTNGLDVNADGTVDGTDRYWARSLHARHLFCLASLFLNPGFAPPCPQETTLSPADHRQLLIRRLAQWSVNAVDFRDSDAIMTAFEYDANPWDGWQVDGNPGTDGTAGNPEILNGTNYVFTNPNDRGLVWGTESPDLLITETLAFHDRRVKDTDKAGPMDRKRRPGMGMGMGMGVDEDLDQFRVPQGSLFIELYSPKNTAARNPRLPRELYDANGRLELARMAPGTMTSPARPVWRLALSKITEGDGANSPRQPFNMGAFPESASFEPGEVSLLPPGAGRPSGALPIERYVWFAPPGGGVPEAAQIFYANSNPVLEPGQYAMVAPRLTTYLGSCDPDQTGASPGSLWGGNSEQRIQINAGNIVLYDTAGAPTATTPGPNTRPAVPIIAQMPNVTPTGLVGGTPTPWGSQWTVGLNITEPLPSQNYYPEPTAPVMAAGADRSFYDDPEVPLNDGTGFKDKPVEASDETDAVGRPIHEYDMQPTGTYVNAASVFLQRLANPNLPYNPLPPDPLYDSSMPINPYISVDWATIDATVFTGEEDTRGNMGMGMGGAIDPDDQPGDRPGNPPDQGEPLGTRQRGYPQPSAGVADANWWNPNTEAADVLQAAAAPEPYFRWDYSSTDHTLPYLNDTVSTPQAGPYIGEPNLTTGMTPQTVPWLTWNNRPYASPFELLVVPSSSPSRLCSELTPGPLTAFLCNDAFASTDPMALRSPFGQLLNFFHTDNNPTDSPQLHRLLDFLEVPSPYSGTEQWYNPGQFGTAGLYRPPFNKMSRFRDPGRININTIFFDDPTWIAAISQFPGMNTGAFADKVWRSRRGFGGSDTSLVDSSGNPVPTLFGNPFRSADASDLMPNIGTPNMRRDLAVEATFLRPDPDVAGQPLFDQASNQSYNSTVRNPYFRYQALQKLGNTFTTHSNVFAVWMTVGYFEVEEVPNWAPVTGNDQKSAWPDGYRLGQEVGLDSGEVQRHRAFFIIDRSVPVGYMPGEKLNSDQCILLKRFIE